MQLKKDWKTRLDEAKKRGRFTKDDKTKIRFYDTCFIGEHYNKPYVKQRIPFAEEGLGELACTAVINDDVAEAERIYNAVQKLYCERALRIASTDIFI